MAQHAILELLKRFPARKHPGRFDTFVSFSLKSTEHILENLALFELQCSADFGHSRLVSLAIQGGHCDTETCERLMFALDNLRMFL